MSVHLLGFLFSCCVDFLDRLRAVSYALCKAYDFNSTRAHSLNLRRKSQAIAAVTIAQLQNHLNCMNYIHRDIHRVVYKQLKDFFLKMHVYRITLCVLVLISKSIYDVCVPSRVRKFERMKEAASMLQNAFHVNSFFVLSLQTLMC